MQKKRLFTKCGAMTTLRRIKINDNKEKTKI